MTSLRNWAESQGWPVLDRTHELHEKPLGTYRAPGLEIHIPPRRLFVEPVARYVLDGEGRVELLIYPTFDHFVLIREEGQWHVFDDELTTRGPLSADRFVEMMRELAEAA